MMQKEKFLTPKINIQKTRELYAVASAKWNAQYYDENGKFIREGSKKLSPMHREVFIALVVVMNARLKVQNLSTPTPEERNYIRNPFKFSVSTYDIQNVMTQRQGKVKDISRKTISRALDRFMYDTKYIISKDWRSAKGRYDVVLNTDLVHFQELSPYFLTSLKSVVNKSKNPNSPTINIYNTNINNKKTNHSDFNEGKNLQANFHIKTKKQNKLEQVKSIPDNRKLSEKKQDYLELKNEIIKKNDIASEKKSSAEILRKIDETIAIPKKTRRFNDPEINKLVDDFLFFKQKIINDFYILMLTMLWSVDKVKLYSPLNTASPLYMYTLQSLNELEKNTFYFGNCETKEDFIQRKSLLTDALIRAKTDWINKRESFNTEHLAPNRFLNGTYAFMKFSNAVKYHIKKLNKTKQNSNNKAFREVNKTSFYSALKFIETAIPYKRQMVKNQEFRKFIKVKYDYKEQTYHCKAMFQDNETFSYMQRLITKIKNTENFYSKKNNNVYTKRLSV